VERSGPTGETSAIQDLGVLAREAGRTDEALEHFEDALARRREQFEPPHPAISDLLIDIGRALAGAGDFPGSMARLGEALAMTRERRGTGTDVADLLTRIADVAVDAGLLDEAERHLAEAEAELEGLPPGTSFAARHGFVAARLDLARGDTASARERLATVRPWYERQFTPEHPERVLLDEIQRDVTGDPATTPS
jgi:tetratricopeptide (TPR) repeat protein